MERAYQQLADSNGFAVEEGGELDVDRDNSGYKKEYWNYNRIRLEEKYFRRIGEADIFKGDKVDAASFNTYLFDLISACNQADKVLGSVLRRFMSDVCLR